MRELVAKALRKSVLVAVAAVLLVSWGAALTAAFMGMASADTPATATGGPGTTTAPGQLAADTSTCTPQNPNEANTNIIFCGLLGTTASDQAADLQAYLDGTKTDPHHSDVQSILKDHGLTDAMFTNGTWELGETQKDSSNHGTLVFQGQTIGTNVTVFARCVVTNQFCPGSNGAVTGSNALFFGNSSAMPTLIHTTNGVVDFAIWSPCGNVMTVTPPVKSLTCDSLTAALQSQNNAQSTYTFTAAASQQNTPITSYVFDFGDTSGTATIQTTDTTATTTHTYMQTGAQQTLTAQVSVNGTTTSAACKRQIIIPAVTVTPPAQQSLACISLNAVTQADKRTVDFSGTAQANGTTIQSYTFNFGDGTSITQAGQTAVHTYASPGTFTASFSATDTHGNTTPASDAACKTTVTTAPPAPTALPNTGSGSAVGIFAAASTFGVAVRQIAVLRRKLL